MKSIKKWSFTQVMVFGFLALILVGACILMLPICNANGKWLNFPDALFTSCTCVCVTGLVTVVPAFQFTFLGKLVMLFLIQVGGWGVIVCVTYVLVLMKVKLTIQERLKDLRVERSLTLEQLSVETGISKSALGKYEADDFKDISPFSMVELAKFYGVSTDYLLGLTEQKNHPNTELDALHLGDDAIEVLRTGKFNHRLLSELICHKDFQRFMLDAEIYVDRIADMRVNDMNAVLEAVRQMALMKNGGEENDLHLRTLEVAQIREDEYFGSLIADDLKGILRDIRSEHRPDTMTADEVSFAENIQNQLRDAMNFEGSSEEKKAKALLATLGIDYDAITMEQFVNLIEVLKLSRHLKTPISQRGKTTMTHGKGKRKKR